MSGPDRYWWDPSPDVRARVASLAGVAHEPWMQDWPLEVADPERMDELLALYEQRSDDGEKRALMELALYSLDELPDSRSRRFWPHLERLLLTAGTLHAGAVIYWSCLRATTNGGWTFESEDEHFGITPLARRALRSLRRAIGFDELSVPDDDPNGVLTTATAASAARELRELLDEASDRSRLPADASLGSFLSALERVVTEAFASEYDEWRWRAIDGFAIDGLEISGPGEIELLGLSHVLSEDDVAPVSVRAALSTGGDRIVWLECLLGRSDGPDGELASVRSDPGRLARWLHRLETGRELIDWELAVEVGTKPIIAEG